ncbi:MAG: TetR/AcrR family transcriptional regulator [Armatimonadetes bacterium]|nr:TetR/AcrR family transcriptional regulator [Anaerolineae bacterium]
MPTTTRKPDRRVVRTRHLLRDALMTLITERGYDAITVQDIADQADVARTTFYLHFKDKDELLFEGMREIYAELFERLMVPSPDANADFPIDLANPADFEHVAQYADFYRVMLSERGSIAFLLRVQAFLAQMFIQELFVPLTAKGWQPRVPVEVAAYCCAGAQIAMIKWWLDNGMQQTPAVMGQIGKELSLYGTVWGMGMPQHPSSTDAPG